MQDWLWPLEPPENGQYKHALRLINALDPLLRDLPHVDACGKRAVAHHCIAIRAHHIRGFRNLRTTRSVFRRSIAMAENVAREFAETGAARAKETFGKVQAAAEESTKVMEQAVSTASKGAADFNSHLLDIAQKNMNAAFDLAR